jgi:hypothetical protein
MDIAHGAFLLPRPSEPFLLYIADGGWRNGGMENQEVAPAFRNPHWSVHMLIKIMAHPPAILRIFLPEYSLASQPHLTHLTRLATMQLFGTARPHADGSCYCTRRFLEGRPGKRRYYG